MSRLITALSAALILAQAALAMAADLRLMERENAALESELTLAKKKENYLIFDLDGMRVDVKSQGLMLKSASIASKRSWHGYTTPPRIYTLAAKEASGAPERKVIKPKDPGDVKIETAVQTANRLNQDTFEVQAMEIGDMPTSYRLSLDGGLRLYVRQAGEGISGWLRDSAHSVAWYAGQSLSAGWSRIRGRQYESIELTMAERDAQAIYWAFLVNTSCVVK